MNSPSKSNHKWYVLVALTLTFLSPPLVRAAVPDIDINYNVKDALRADPRVSGSQVIAATMNGIVTLTGTIDNLAAKTFAVAETKKINGVLGVIDKIDVVSGFRLDTDISNAVRRRILNSAVIKSQGLVIMCDNGVVSLSGTVASYPEEQQAGLLASEVRGVKEVRNDIRTNWSNSRSDLEIKNDAVAALGRDVYLVGLPITVSVQSGVVTLSGSVGNANEKDRAFTDVRWIGNVSDVKNGLIVKWYENRGVKSENETPSDDTLKLAVRKTLDQDSRLADNDITIRTSSGQVTLDGPVSSNHEKGIAEQDAKNVVGVAWVMNNLFIRGEQREDWAIEDDIDFNLSTDAVTDGFGLSGRSRVKNGMATLTGKVHSWSQWSHAYDVAGRVRGVKGVIDNINVSSANDPNGSNWKKDGDLATLIKSRLRSDWTTWWVADKISVTVHNGVATIEGDVGTWKERQEAADRTLHTLGISEVDNRLTVQGIDYPWDQHRYSLTSY